MVRPSSTQTLDKCWDYCKKNIPKQINAEDLKASLLELDLRVAVALQQSHNRHNLWQMVPEVMRHIGNHWRLEMLQARKMERQ